jgi:biopolymer transport protein ExbD
MSGAQQNSPATAASQLTAFTSPLGLQSQLKRPEWKVDLIPLLDLIVIALLFSLLFTRFVMVPGVRVDLPASDLRIQFNHADVAVLTIGNNGMLYFSGNVYGQKTIATAFKNYLAQLPDRQAVLLIKAQADFNLESFLELCGMAQSAGFTQVQIAAAQAPVNSDAAHGAAPNSSAIRFPQVQ